ncbi:MAG: DUF1674 domain-containing protein [Alphaproteobacteria bacterium]
MAKKTVKPAKAGAGGPVAEAAAGGSAQNHETQPKVESPADPVAEDYTRYGDWTVKGRAVDF